MPLTLTSCNPLGGHLYEGPKALILINMAYVWFSFPRTWTRCLSCGPALGISSISRAFARSHRWQMAQTPCEAEQCFAHDSGTGQSLEILASTCFWSIWDWTTIFKCHNELSVISLLQTLHYLHGPIDQDSAALPSLIPSIPIVKTCVLQLNCRSVLQSEHMFPLSDMACHLMLSLYEAQWVEPKLLSLEWIRCFLGTSFLTTLSPSTTVRRSKTLSQDGLVLFFLLPVDTSRASPLNPSHECVWWTPVLLKAQFPG